MKIRRIILIIFIVQPLLTLGQTKDKCFKCLNEALIIHADSVTCLRLRDKKLKAIPKEVFNFNNLQYLDLGMNRIKQVPKKIKNLRNLKELNLAYNPLVKIPDEICSLTNLTYLNLLDTELKSLPNYWSDSNMLSYLNLNGTHIIDLPETFFEIPNITELYLGTKIENQNKFSEENQKKIIKKFPNAKVYF